MANSDTELREEPATPASLLAVEGDTVKRDVRLSLLLAAHVILGLFLCIRSAAQGRLSFVLLLPVFGVVLAQSSLLGFWAGISPAKWWMRLVGMIVGIPYLEFLLRIGTRYDDFTGMAALATGGIAAIFCLVRWRYADLRRFPQPVVRTDQEGLKVSIRGLMLFTFVVATTIVGVEALRENAPVRPNFLAISTWSLCFVVVGLAGVWAGLGLARPTLRSVVLLLVSAVLGALFVYSINQSDWETYFSIIAIMVLQASALIASLLVVRSCGYRLVRRSTPDVEPLD